MRANLEVRLVDLLHRFRPALSRGDALESFATHPDSPSFAALVDTLREAGLRAEAMRVPPDKLDRLPTPFLAEVRGGDLLLVDRWSSAKAAIVERGRCREVDPREVAGSLEGTVLVVEEEAAGAAERERPIARRRDVSAGAPSATAGLALIAGCAVAAVIAVALFNAAWGAAMVAKAGTALVAMALVLDPYLRFSIVDRVCAADARWSCREVMESKLARIFAPFTPAQVVACATLGSMTLIAQLPWLAGSAQPPCRGIIAAVQGACLAGVLGSLVAQVAMRKACLVCIALAGSIVVESIFVYAAVASGGWSLGAEGLPYLLPFVLCAGLWLAVRGALERARDGESFRLQLLRLLRSPGVLSRKLEGQVRVDVPAALPAVSLGPDDALHTLTLVTHPRCPHCADAHRVAKELQERHPERLNVRIVPLCDPARDPARLRVAGVLGTWLRGDRDAARRAVAGWYGERSRAARGDAEDDAPDERALRAMVEIARWGSAQRIRRFPTVLWDGFLWPAGLDLEHAHALLGESSAR